MKWIGWQFSSAVTRSLNDIHSRTMGYVYIVLAFWFTSHCARCLHPTNFLSTCFRVTSHWFIDIHIPIVEHACPPVFDSPHAELLWYWHPTDIHDPLTFSNWPTLCHYYCSTRSMQTARKLHSLNPPRILAVYKITKNNPNTSKHIVTINTRITATFLHCYTWAWLRESHRYIPKQQTT